MITKNSIQLHKKAVRDSQNIKRRTIYIIVNRNLCKCKTNVKKTKSKTKCSTGLDEPVKIMDVSHF